MNIHGVAPPRAACRVVCWGHIALPNAEQLDQDLFTEPAQCVVCGRMLYPAMDRGDWAVVSHYVADRLKRWQPFEAGGKVVRSPTLGLTPLWELVGVQIAGRP